MTVTCRDGRPGDGAALAKLFGMAFAETFGHLYAKEDLAAFLRDNGESTFERELADRAFAVRLVEDANQLAGYAKLGPNDLPGDAPSGTLELHQLYLLRPWHGRGLAQQLMDWTLAEARSRVATHLQLSVFVDNHRARRFYERYGFEEVGHYVFMVGNHADDDRIMRLAL
ncbi:MAG: GNAT family N-acetyltransferase [Sphingomicrobium sp.]